MALGLAAPPPERVPVESLSQEALVRQAIQDRYERAKTERMVLRSEFALVLTGTPLENRLEELFSVVAKRGQSFASFSTVFNRRF